MAEGGGFEPPEACTSTVFKTVAFVRSAILPPAIVGVASEPAPIRVNPDTFLQNRVRLPMEKVMSFLHRARIATER